MPLIFTDSGLLTPAAGIEASLEIIETQFVNAFPGSTSRKRLFDNFQRYVYRFQDEIFPWFDMWVNGSFVTKKENPKDVDVVTFLDWKVYELREQALERFWRYNLENEGIDAYFVKVYPENHTHYQEFLLKKETFDQLFIKNRNSEPKGYLILKFGKNVE